jgi:hypothetical protein
MLDDINRSNRDGRLSLEPGGADDPFGVGLDRKTGRSANHRLRDLEAHDDGMRATAGEGERELDAPRAEFPAKVCVNSTSGCVNAARATQVLTDSERSMR